MVSLIIPLYNREAFIGATLDSIKSQSDSNWECIIVDDGSSDNSFTIVLDYIKKDCRFKLYKRPSEYKAGGNGARNYGFEQSNGQFINFIDSDDILHCDFIKCKLEAIQNSNVDVIISKTVITSLDINEVIAYENRTSLTDFLLDDFITLKVSWYMVDPMWKKEFLLNKKLFNEDLLKGQDRDFHIRRLIENPKIEILDKYLYYYRNNKNSISTDISQNTAMSMLEAGFERNVMLLKNNIKDTTRLFLYKQMIKLYPLVYKSQKAKNLYFKILLIFFRFKKDYLILSFKFFVAIVSFRLFGKGEKLLK